MAGSDKIAAALKHVTDIFEETPARAMGTDKTTARLERGLKCTIREGDQSAVVDMVEKMGGGAEGPSPGFFGRAALTSCIAIGLKMTAARAGIDIDAIEVDLEMDWDHRGLFGLNDSPAGTTGMRVLVTVQSDAPEQAVHDVVQQSLTNSPWLQTFVDAQKIEPEVRIRPRP